MERDALVGWLDEYLLVREIEDSSWNGLQVEGAAEVTRVGVAVDACDVTIEAAIADGCQLLLVHHGLYWGKGFRITGPDRRRVKLLLDGELSLYAAHLPLDAHLEVGNNVELLRLLGISEVTPFGRARGVSVGCRGRLAEPMELAEIAERLEQALETQAKVFSLGADPVREVAAISGEGGFGVFSAPSAGVELLITGEWDHSKFHAARDREVNVITAGHYKTETVGVQALARVIEAEHGLPWAFFDFPSGV